MVRVVVRIVSQIGSYSHKKSEDRVCEDRCRKIGFIWHDQAFSIFFHFQEFGGVSGAGGVSGVSGASPGRDPCGVGA